MLIKKTAALLTIVAAALGLVTCRSKAPSASATASPAAFQTEDQKTLYALGVILGQELVGPNLKPFRLSAEESTIVQKGLADALNGAKPLVDPATYGPKVQAMHQARLALETASQKRAGQGLADAAAKEPGATRSASGVIQRTVQPGRGPSPKASDVVRVHYEGRLADGTVFDSSIKRGEPAEFQVQGVIPCWREGVQKMKVGEKAKLVCPPETAYGEGGQGPIPGGATLFFEVELLEIKKR